jgi:hypothetical protein
MFFVITFDCKKDLSYFRTQRKYTCQSQWSRGQIRRSTTTRLMRLWFRIPPGAWMSVFCDCCVLSGRGLCDVLNTRTEESFRMCCVNVCDIETSWMRRHWPTGGCFAKRRQKKKKHNWIQIGSAKSRMYSLRFLKFSGPKDHCGLLITLSPGYCTSADDDRQLSRTIWTASSMLRNWLAIKVLILRSFLSVWLRDTTECFGQYRFSGNVKRHSLLPWIFWRFSSNCVLITIRHEHRLSQNTTLMSFHPTYIDPTCEHQVSYTNSK